MSRVLYLPLLLVFAVGLPFPYHRAQGGTAVDWSVFGPGTPLTAAEEASPNAAMLARRFNPAMALPDDDGPWPVSVAYMWSGGSDLRARTRAPDGGILRDQVAVPNARLDRFVWDDLPTRDPAGNGIEYWIDAPGDDRLENGVSGWRRRWSETAGHSPMASRYPPTQYAHIFWLNRARGLLAIQYWFFFPYNEWINHHEGDWEHINVILEGPSHLGLDAGFRPVGYEFYFHEWRLIPERVVRITGEDDGGDHVVVYVGGKGRLLWLTGRTSGGSYPLPASYRGAGDGVGLFRPAEDTRRPARFLPADTFQIVLLPEPARLDTQARPELSWLKLPFLAGQPRVYENPLLIDRFGGGGPPKQPARRREWNALATEPLWTGVPSSVSFGETLLNDGENVVASKAGR